MMTTRPALGVFTRYCLSSQYFMRIWNEVLRMKFK